MSYHEQGPDEPPRPRGMQVQSIRFSAEQWAIIQDIAGGSGVSAGQFVREAAVMRAVALAVMRGGSEKAALWLRTLEALNEHGLEALQAAYAMQDDDEGG